MRSLELWGAVADKAFALASLHDSEAGREGAQRERSAEIGDSQANAALLPLCSAELVVRFRHLHPAAASSRANVGIKRTTSNYLSLVEHLNLTFDTARAANGDQMSNSLH